MNPATRPAGEDRDRDPDIHPVEGQGEVGPAKRPDSAAGDPERRRRQFRLRTLLGVIALVAVGMGVLLDPNVAPLVLVILGAIGIGVGVMVAAMALGLVGFGLFAAGGRVIDWLRRASRWPEE